MPFWMELKRRNVVRVAAGYAIAAWLLVQVADTLLPAFGAPEWVLPVFILLLAMGFVVAVILSWAYELTPEGVKRTADVPDGESIRPITGRKLDFVIIGVMAVAIVYLVVDNYLIDREPGGGPQAAAASANTESSAAADQRPARLPNSIAVLPLENMSPDANNAYVAAGLHEEILNQLAKLRNLNVIARTSVLQYAQNKPPIPEIAAALNVESIMEGSVRYAGNRIRVTTQLIDAGTGAHLWSETYERQFDDIFAIESDIAMNVANALNAEFSAEEQARIERPPTDNALAYDYLLQARSLIGVGDQAPRMHELLDRAIELDPNFAAAYGWKATLYSTALNNTVIGAAGRPDELEPLVRDYAGRAFAIDPETPNALGAFAVLAVLSWRWTEAAGALDRLYTLTNASEFDAMWFRSWSGAGARALLIGERQVAINPLDWASHFSFGVVLDYAADHRRAAQVFRDGIALAPNLSLQHSWLAVAEIALGNTDVAHRELELAEQLLGENRTIVSLLDIAYSYGRIGDGTNARRLYAEVTRAVDAGLDIGTGGRALAHLAIGEYDEALEWLGRGVERAQQHQYDAGFYSLMNLKLNYTADPALEQAAFIEVRNRLRGD